MKKRNIIAIYMLSGVTLATSAISVVADNLNKDKGIEDQQEVPIEYAFEEIDSLNKEEDDLTISYQDELITIKGSDDTIINLVPVANSGLVNANNEPEEIIDNDYQSPEYAYVKEETTLYSNSSDDSLYITSLNIYDPTIRLASCNNGWALVKQNNYIGYVQEEKIDYIDTNTPVEYTHSLERDIIITTDALNFRTGPGVDNKILYTLKKGTELDVIAKVSNNWLMVRHNGNIGYVHGSYVMSMLDRANELYPEINLEELAPQSVVYTTTSLNFRTGNSTDFESLGVLEKYETLRVIKEIDDWYFVMTNDYNFGYVNKNYTKILKNRYVIVDKSEQRLYLYDDNNLLYVTPVTTGKDSTPSDTGYFSIYSKETDRYLTGADYRSYVKYWMPYNGGEGLHDASWRSVFGTDSYHTKGSHGCINIPPEITGKIYENVEVGTKVLVHK